ncbi:MAG: nitroreductase family protein [Planctomycetota bacterium]|jgi:nitroreductase|nr:nitroreductase family protein [Planctomycetota bacterium]
MEFFDVVKRRRSIREFSDKEVPRRLIEECLDAARLAPSGTNAQPWRFLVVQSPERRAALAEAGFNQPCLRNAPVILALLGDLGVDRKRLRRAKELGDAGAISGDALAILEDKYGNANETKTARSARIAADCMIAGEHYALAAAALGLGACWVMLFDREKAAAALGLDAKNNFPVALMPTGYPLREPHPRPRYGLAEVAWDEMPGRPWEAVREE